MTATARFALPLVAAAALILPTLAAHAAVTEFDDAASFDAAVGPTVTHGFSGIVPAGQDFVIGAQTVAGVTFDSDVIPFTIPAAATPTYGVDFFSGQSASAAPSDVKVSFAGTYALGFTYGSYISTRGTPVTITLSSGDTFTQNYPALAEDTNFFGFVSTAPITSVTFTTIANDNTSVQFAYSVDVTSFTTAVPEPAPVALLAAGVGLILVRRRRS